MRQSAGERAFPQEVADRAHEHFLDRDRLHAIFERDLFARVELELTLGPPQHLQQQAIGLLAQGTEQLVARQNAAFDEVVRESLAGALVPFRDAREVLGADESLARQHLSQALFEILVERVGGDDLAVQERDGEDVVLALHGQNAGLLLLRDHLQDVGQTKYAQIAFERHGRTLFPFSELAAHAEPDIEQERRGRKGHQGRAAGRPPVNGSTTPIEKISGSMATRAKARTLKATLAPSPSSACESAGKRARSQREKGSDRQASQTLG